MAIVYSGEKWGSGTFGTAGGTVTYAFATATSNTSYTFTDQLDAAYQAAVIAALGQWALYADIDFAYSADANSADIVFGWDTIDQSSGVLAETAYSYNPVSDILLSAEIRFDTAENWAPTNAETDRFETSFYAVALHEIGHAIGLDHSTANDSIMYAFYGDYLELTAVDIAGIEALYGSGAYVGTPGSTTDAGGWAYGWHLAGTGLAYGWHVETGWDYGWFGTSSGWEYGYYHHSGWEYGWYSTGSWVYGWFFDYGGMGWGGTNIAWQNYGWYGGDIGHESWGWSPPLTWFNGASTDSGSLAYGWYKAGGWGYGWHQENGWDFGWYDTSSGSAYGWFYHAGWEYGWYGNGTWRYGWYYDYGGHGTGSNLGWQYYGWFGGDMGNETAPTPGWYYGDSIDFGHWTYGWYKFGGWGWGWHLEGGWDYGWFDTASGWDYGWYVHEGWEFGWYGTGAWRYGWFYDYGGSGIGWNLGWETYGWNGGLDGHESYA